MEAARRANALTEPAPLARAPAAPASDRHNAALHILLVRADSADLPAFKQFCASTAPWLLQQVRALVAEDAVEVLLGDAYIRAWSCLPYYLAVEAASVQPLDWLLRIARGCASEPASVPALPATEQQEPTHTAPRLLELVHDIRGALSTAKLAMRALGVDRLQVDSATGRALQRSLDDIESLLAHGMEMLRESPRQQQRPKRVAHVATELQPNGED